MGTAATIVALSLAAPLILLWMILHYSSNWHKNRSLTGQEEELISTLRRTADRLEDRITNIERILDADAPTWKDNSEINS